MSHKYEMAKNTLSAGDQIAYAAKHLRNTGQFTGDAPKRRGVFIKVCDHTPTHAYVRWDDFEARADYYAKQYGDDYVADARAHGQLVALSAIAKVGSPRFALNDL